MPFCFQAKGCNRRRWKRPALDALEWLMSIQTSDEGPFCSHRQRGILRSRRNRARFDQQPIEAHATISACIDAFHVTGPVVVETGGLRTFEWFLGRNDAGTAVYDSLTGGCGDGLSAEGPSANQGAESTLVFLLSLAEFTCWNTSFLPPARKRSSTVKSKRTRRKTCPAIVQDDALIENRAFGIRGSEFGGSMPRHCLRRQAGAVSLLRFGRLKFRFYRIVGRHRCKV